MNPELDHAREERMRGAAPELYEALRALIEQADDGPRACYGRDSGGREDWKGSFHALIETARAALAKVTP